MRKHKKNHCQFKQQTQFKDQFSITNDQQAQLNSFVNFSQMDVDPNNLDTKVNGKKIKPFIYDLI